MDGRTRSTDYALSQHMFDSCRKLIFFCLLSEGGETNGKKGMDQPAMEALVNPVEDEEIGWI